VTVHTLPQAGLHALDVVSINRGRRLALLNSGDTVPITTLFDGDGDEVDTWDTATAFVCGAGDLWLADACSHFDPAGRRH
jgi:hypothetical protein